MGQAAELTGPDLSAGVDASRLEEGRPLLGHAGGEAVMLVRVGEAVHATSATCTHYSGPLAEGLVVGGTVRCPWHHACFDLATGRAAAPALTPLACFEVVRAGALVRVGKKRVDEKPGAAKGPSSVVIVGGGAAGAACAEGLRRLGYVGAIALVADEPPGPVDRPNLSKDYLAGKAPEEWIPLRDAAFYREHGVELVMGDAAALLDTNAQSVTLTSGRRLAYGALLLATGSAPRTLDVPGAESANVFVLRTLADSRAIVAKATSGARAVVIGASFIGLEVAASLRARGVEVDVVGAEKIPLARVVGDEIGAFVKALHEKNGVRFHMEQKPSQIPDDAVVLESGTRLAADFVVLGVGVTPNVALAENAGLRVDRGVVVDEKLRTSAEGVYAAGDIARLPEAWSGALVRIEHWAYAERQGQAVARAMLGDGAPFRDVPFFWSAHYDTTINYVGHAEGWDKIRTRGTLASGKYAAAFERAGRVLAVATVGDDSLSLEVEAAMEAGDARKVADLFA